ncbi:MULTISPECIES: SCO family protein [unclassified Bacillus (in: firmicutes)]|uniref:SCO family protein n=1 Tax=unclassified Bacillus (in: firmicutes) TaxID=185979 RepID=UPI0008E1ED06|nr:MULTISPECIES: SCO family protein [unclassified Bacillus (in: firmicutes)]SFA92241.1 protein SCO1/2 [Bacillus sp. UNCCL13]SFQ85851.1 protein SCO1/2 [Bacillus sp. cl95]
MKQRWLIICMVFLAFMLVGCGQGEIKDATDWPIKDFTYKNQDNKNYGLKDLKGKIWVADFVFTSCEDVCLPMTANMIKLQELVKKEGIKNVEFVSFSVDPVVDSPEALKNYAAKFNVDFKNWNFLTGYTQQEIEQFALKNFKALVKKPEQEDQVIHGTDFYLIDQNGTIKKYYTGLDEVPFEEIIEDMKTLE